MDLFVNDFQDWKKQHNIKPFLDENNRKRYLFDSESFNNNYDTFNSSAINDSFNTKIKCYPDGTKNFYYAPTSLYGNCSYCKPSKKQKSLFTVYYQQKKQYEKILYDQLERAEIENLIQVYFKSVDNFLLCEKQSRDFDNQLIVDSLVLRDFDITFDDRNFLDSLVTNIRHDNLKRAKDSIYDLVYTNDWEWFFTGTIDSKKLDSSDPKALRKPLQNWFKNMQKRYGLSYVCIFEHHKKGGIHIHGLIRSSPLTPLKLVASNTKSYYGFKRPMTDKTALKHGLNPEKGQTVYNLSTWKFGFSTAIKVYGNRGSLAHYITKYITKDNEKIMGRYYWHSRDLQKPKLQYCNTDYDSLRLPIHHGWKFDLQLAPDQVRELHQFTDWETIDYDLQEDNAFMEGWVDI